MSELLSVTIQVGDDSTSRGTRGRWQTIDEVVDGMGTAIAIAAMDACDRDDHAIRCLSRALAVCVEYQDGEVDHELLVSELKDLAAWLAEREEERIGKRLPPGMKVATDGHG